jgi:bacterioferritin-associated ferredoxin
MFGFHISLRDLFTDELCFCRFFDGLLAAVVTALTAHAVHEHWRSAVGAGSQCGSCGFIMRPSFAAARFGMSSFRIWHGLSVLYLGNFYCKEMIDRDYYIQFKINF